MKLLCPNDQSSFDTLQLTKKQQEEDGEDKIQKNTNEQ